MPKRLYIWYGCKRATSTKKWKDVVEEAKHLGRTRWLPRQWAASWSFSCPFLLVLCVFLIKDLFFSSHSKAGTAIASTRELVAQSGFLTIVAFDLGCADFLCTALKKAFVISYEKACIISHKTLCVWMLISQHAAKHRNEVCLAACEPCQCQRWWHGHFQYWPRSMRPGRNLRYLRKVYVAVVP